MTNLVRLILVLIVSLLAACDTFKPEDDVYGKWRTSENQYWTFNRDHSLTVEDITKSAFLNRGRLAAKIATVKQDEVRLTWIYNAQPTPRLLNITISFPDGEKFTIYGIQEFTSAAVMRYGVNGFDVPPPKSFAEAAAILTLTKQ